MAKKLPAKKSAKKLPAKRPVGRPTKYKPEFCKLLIEEAKKGSTIEMIAADLGVHKDTIYEWQDKHPEFSDALKLGRSYQEAFWSRRLMEASVDAKGELYNSSVLMFIMKCRFGWRDRDSATINQNITQTQATKVENKDIKIIASDVDVEAQLEEDARNADPFLKEVGPDE